jgi:hypothetical protein
VLTPPLPLDEKGALPKRNGRCSQWSERKAKDGFSSETPLSKLKEEKAGHFLISASLCGHKDSDSGIVRPDVPPMWRGVRCVDSSLWFSGSSSSIVLCAWDAPITDGHCSSACLVRLLIPGTHVSSWHVRSPIGGSAA